MADACNEQAVLLENLKDAGCDSRMIERGMDLYNEAQLQKMLPELKKFRTCLLDNIHREQDKLSSLDYLIYRLEKK